jgi:putative exporter of polyketide antibiotics
MLVFEVLVAASLVVLVAGGLLVVLVVERSGRRPRFNPIVWGCVIFGFGLIGVAIAWITSAISG